MIHVCGRDWSFLWVQSVVHVCGRDWVQQLGGGCGVWVVLLIVGFVRVNIMVEMIWSCCRLLRTLSISIRVYWLTETGNGTFRFLLFGDGSIRVFHRSRWDGVVLKFWKALRSWSRDRIGSCWRFWPTRLWWKLRLLCWFYLKNGCAELPKGRLLT